MDREAKQPDPAVLAATAIFAQHGDVIRAAIRFQAGNKLDHDDLFQEFYLSLVRRPLPEDVRDIRSYLYRAVLNFVTSALRQQSKDSHRLKKYIEETEISINNEATRDAIVNRQKGATVTRLAGQLQERLAQALVLRYRDDCSIVEIAVKMGVNKRTVSRYLSESVYKLRRRLAAE